MTAEELRSMRISRGLTQQALADALGVSRSLVANWETSRGLIPDRYAVGLAEISERPHVSVQRLTEFHRAQRARRTRIGYLDDRICIVCGREFRGPFWRKTCSATCHRRTQPQQTRKGLPRRFDEIGWSLIADALSGAYSARELADLYALSHARTVTTTLLSYGVSFRDAKAGSGLRKERDLRIAREFLEGDAMTEIATRHGVSKQRVQQILARGGLGLQRRKKGAVNSENQRAAMRKYRPPTDGNVDSARKMMMRLEGAELRDARIRAGISQSALAEILEVKPETVSRWECGRWVLLNRAREWIRSQANRSEERSSR